MKEHAGRLQTKMKPSIYTTLALVISGFALCLVSLYMLRTNERPPPITPALSLPQGSYQVEASSTEEPQLGFYSPASSDAGRPAFPVAETAPQVIDAEIARIRVPRVGIDAPIETKGVDSSGVMQNPHGPSNVAWYDFSARPGTVGNIVVAGHVDYHNYGPAVFWRLRDLKQGDRVEVLLVDGQTFVYEVESSRYYSAATAPVGDIVGKTSFEALTMITCGGSFDRNNQEYDDRLVVRAKRVLTTATSLNSPSRPLSH